MPVLSGTSQWARQDKLTAGTVEVLTAAPVQWERVELRAAVTGTFATPFDPEEIAVNAAVTAPSGRKYSVPAFYYRRFERQVRGGRDNTTTEIMVAPDPPEWRVRLMPSEPGAYSVRIMARDRSGTAASGPATFTVKAAAGHGYLPCLGKTRTISSSMMARRTSQSARTSWKAPSRSITAGFRGSRRTAAITAACGSGTRTSPWNSVRWASIAWTTPGGSTR